MSDPTEAEDNEGDDEETTFKEWFTEKLDEIFVRSLPIDSIKELPPVYMYSIGIISQIAALSLFLYFIITGYQQGVGMQFMSLEKSAGSCEVVEQAVSGQFTADINGNWLGSDNFQYSLGIFQVVLQQFYGSSEVYENMIEQDRLFIQNMSYIMTRSNLATNLIIWMGAYTSAIVNNNLQLFSPIGTPESVFAKEYYYATVANSMSGCNASAVASFDVSDSVMSITYSYSNYASQPSCMNVASPEYFGYNAQRNGNDFSLQIDFNSLTVALSVNIKLLEVGDLQPVSDSQTFQISYNGSNYLVSQYFDESYVGMDPIFCTSFIDGITPDIYNYCILKIGSAYGLPLLNHFGTGYSPQYCQCNTTNGGPAEYLSNEDIAYCNSFDLMPGFLFYDTGPVDSQIAILEMLTNHGNAAVVNKMAYNASFAASVAGYSGIYDPTAYEDQWVAEAYEFCRSETYGNCSLVMMNVYDNISSTVTTYNYQLINGFCTASLEISDEAWYSIAKNPPVELTQLYYKCTQEWGESLFNAVGIASGNIGTIVPFVVLLTLPLMFFLLRLIGHVPKKEEYTRQDREDALASLSLQLLRMRDGKTKGLKTDGALYHLTKELIESAKADFGYPDSDDSDDEEDGTGYRISAVQNIVQKSTVQPIEKSAPEEPVLLKQKGSNTMMRQKVFTMHSDGSVAHTHVHKERESMFRPSHARPSYLRPSQGKQGRPTMDSTYYRESTGSQGPSPVKVCKKTSWFGGMFITEEEVEEEPDANCDTFAEEAENPMFSQLGTQKDIFAASSLADKVHILNSVPESMSFTNVSIKRVPKLLEDLQRYLREAAVMAERESNVKELARNSNAFKKAVEMANILSRVKMQELMKFHHDSGNVFQNLNVLLLSHASLQMDLDVEDIADCHSAYVAYLIGDQVVTAQDLERYGRVESRRVNGPDSDDEETPRPTGLTAIQDEDSDDEPLDRPTVTNRTDDLSVDGIMLTNQFSKPRTFQPFSTSRDSDV